jgi:hypothetical protein
MSANISVENFSSATGASSTKKFDERLSTTSFSRSDGSEKQIFKLG